MKNRMKSIIGVLCLAGMPNAALVPNFTISPQDTVEVGEEMSKLAKGVYFSG